jgi:membrane protease YdiL (CAAX protease family)
MGATGRNFIAVRANPLVVATIRTAGSAVPQWEASMDPSANQRNVRASAQDVGATQPGSAPHGWRQSKWLALAEFTAVALVFVAARWHLIPLSTTPFLLLVGWVALRIRKVGWRDVGLRRPRNWPVALAAGVASGALLEAFQLGVTEPLLVRYMGKHPDLSEFQSLQGNVGEALLALVVVWVLAALGEELIYRGYLMNRVADLGNRTRAAWGCSLLVVSAVFGYAHRYQGWTGIVEEGFAGFLLGLIYLRAGRNLWFPVIAHGVQDSIDVLLIFSGTYPYMG